MKEGKVVRIFDTRRIAVNLGTKDGVQEGDRLEVYTPRTEVVDPDTDEVLGDYRRRKAVLYAREVYERFCVGYPPDRRVLVENPVAEATSPMLAALRPAQYRNEPGQAPINRTQIDAVPTGLEIGVGDLVEWRQEDKE
jgi:hypothetical protein